MACNIQLGTTKELEQCNIQLGTTKVSLSVSLHVHMIYFKYISGYIEEVLLKRACLKDGQTMDYSKFPLEVCFTASD